MTEQAFGVVPRAPGEPRTAVRAAPSAEHGVGSAVAELADPEASPQTLVRRTGLDGVLDLLDGELVGLAPVKTRIREIAALLVVDRLRREHGLASERPSLHMCFTGNPGTGKTTVARRMAEILHRLGYVERGHLVSVTREDLVGQYVGHTAPKTRDVLKKAYGGVLFIDEAYYLHRPENERDYGQEAIEILLQAMENERDKLVVILAGYKDRMDEFFGSNPGMQSRVAHHIDFPDFTVEELMQIGDLMLEQRAYAFSPEAREVFREYIERRRRRPRFAHGRSIRNAIDRARLRQASRLFESETALGRDELITIEAEDLLKSSVFARNDN
ncbi:MAG TPA: CbbX protein [Actinomycetota bacterium]|jgi:probable Rubsico expression protein CbbX|nr:CbbX protein [Actinomycetota bacterium]